MEFAARESIPVSQIRPSPTSDDEYAVQQVGRLPVCFVALIADADAFRRRLNIY